MKILKSLLITILLIVSAFALAVDKPSIKLATTTSTDNSGLLGYLLPIFENKYNIQVKIIATGTGRALELGKKGDVDLVLVHAPAKEVEFITSGFGVERVGLMYNYFLIVGPLNDPANIKSSNSVNQAFNKIAQSKAKFVSRSDQSGTHTKELEIWQYANISPKGEWYKQVGQGMGRTLLIADQLNAYTLIDLATWLKLKPKTSLQKLYSNDPIMFNPYSLILVNPKKHPFVKYQQAQVFSQWISSKKIKHLINQYQAQGQQLFFAK